MKKSILLIVTLFYSTFLFAQTNDEKVNAIELSDATSLCYENSSAFQLKSLSPETITCTQTETTYPYIYDKDIWFTFVASTSSYNFIGLKDMSNSFGFEVSKADGTVLTCQKGSITNSSGKANVNFNLNLVVGARYYIRVLQNSLNSNYIKLCVQPISVPSSPTTVVATAGAEKATVSFNAPSNTGGSSISQYTVTSNPGAITATGTSSPITVTGLTNGTVYTFTVVATNTTGNSLASVVSNSVTPFAITSPSVPTSVSATAGYESANVTFVAPSNNGGSAITQYTVTSNPEGITASGTSSPISVKGLTGGISYTFTIVAINSKGASNASISSNAVTPLAITVPSAPTAVTGTSDYKSALIYFTTSSSNGGSAITKYTVTSNPEGIQATGISSPILVTGLTNGTSYNFTVSATNNKGTSIESLPSSQIVPIAVTNDSLLAHYTFDGNANDASGNGNHGVITGGLTFVNDELGNTNSAALFNGTDSYITIPKPNKLKFPSGGSFTISAKVKASSNPGSGSNSWSANDIFTKYEAPFGGGSEVIQLNYKINGGTVSATVRNSKVSLLSPTGVENSFDKYKQIALVKNAKDNTLNLYIDGELVSSKALVASFSAIADIECWIGKATAIGGASGNLFKGRMDDLKIYIRALSQAEIKDQLTSVENTEILSGVFIGSNPTSSEFDLYTSTPLNISVSSVEGLEIEKFSTSQNLKFGASYTSGVYLVNINNGNTVKVIKVIKQ